MHNRSVAALFTVLCLFLATSGCICHNNSLSNYQFHGKVGYCFACASDVIGVPLDVVALPLTLPIGVHEQNQHPEAYFVALGSIFTPGACIEILFYHVGAAAAYPIHLACEVAPQYVSYSFRRREETITAVLGGWGNGGNPQCSTTEYSILCVAAGRRWAPALRWDTGWGDRWSIVPGAGGAFGRRYRLPAWNASEWKAWDRAGRPVGGRAEALFVLGFWNEHPHVSGKRFYEEHRDRAAFLFAPRQWLEPYQVKYLEDILGVDGATVARSVKSKPASPEFSNASDDDVTRMTAAWSQWILDNGGGGIL